MTDLEDIDLSARKDSGSSAKKIRAGREHALRKLRNSNDRPLWKRQLAAARRVKTMKERKL